MENNKADGDINNLLHDLDCRIFNILDEAKPNLDKDCGFKPCKADGDCWMCAYQNISPLLKEFASETASIKDAEIEKLEGMIAEYNGKIEAALALQKVCDEAHGQEIASAVKSERQNIEEEKRETGYELLNYIENLYPHLHLYDDKNWISLKKEWLKIPDKEQS